MRIDPSSDTCSKCGRRGCWTVAEVIDDVEGEKPVKFIEYTCRCGHVVSEEVNDATKPGFAGGMGLP